MRISDWSSDVCSSDLWTGWRPTHMIGQGLAGKTLGLVGFGRIARATAARARAGFGMTIAYFSRRQADDAGNAVFYPTLDALARDADILSLHVPGGPATRHMIDAPLPPPLNPAAVALHIGRPRRRE